MYDQFKKTESSFNIRDFTNDFVTEQGSYLLLWYALLFNVCAFLKNQNAIPTHIKSDLDSVYEQLNGLRNVVFHIPPTFFDDRFKILISESKFKTISRIHIALSEFFDTELAKYGQETDLTPS